MITLTQQMQITGTG